MRPTADSLLVWTGAACTNGCASCPIDQASAETGWRATDVRVGLANLPSGVGRLVVLVGGEPILRPDLLQLIGSIRTTGRAAGLVTTGRPLLYPQVRERLRRVGLAYARIQLFGVGEAHDRVTAVPGGFEQALTGLRVWIDEVDGQCDVDVALTIRARSATTLLPEVEHLARAIPAHGVQILLSVDPGVELQDESALRQAAADLADWNDDATRPLVTWESLPESIAAASPPTLPPLRPAFVGKAPRACCLGTTAALARASSAASVQTRANSFNFIRTDTDVPYTADVGMCSAYAAVDRQDPLRQLWFVDNARLVLYETDTGDFASTEIARIKDEWSHLFLDRAPAGVLDDFTEGMRRVVADPACATCAHRQACGRRFRLVDGPPFAREEAWIADYITRLRGHVLDVGCGEQLYQKELAPLLASGAVEYTGLDPDEISLERIRAALPQGRYHLGGIEDFWSEPESYDSVLCLRSLNHVADVDEALSRMAALLKPGGSLLIVETTPFALLRRAEQVAAADRAPRAGHQHFRNVTSLDVLPLARRRGLRVVHHHPAGLNSTNEWILLLERTGK